MRFVLLALALLAAGPGPAPAAVDAWEDEINLSQTATDSETGLGHHPLAVTTDGVLHVVWAEKDGPNQNYRIRTRRLDQGAWTGSELIVDYLATDPGTNGGAKYPALAALPDGSLHLFWHDYRVAGINNVEIYTKELAAGSAWNAAQSADVRLTTTSHPETNGDNGYVPVPAVAPDGALHVAWYDFRYDGSNAEILAKHRPAGGSWDLTPGDAADDRVTTDGDGSEFAALGVDAAGDVHAAWKSLGSGTRLFYSVRDSGTGTWSVPTRLDSSSAVAGAPALAVEPSGRVHVVWPDAAEGGRALRTRFRETNGTWSAALRLTPPSFGADEPALSASPDGSVHLVWHDGRNSLFSPEVLHRVKEPGAAWDTTTADDFPVSGAMHGAVRPSVLAHGDDVFVLWRDGRAGNNEIYFRKGGPAATDVSAQPGSGRIALRAFPNPSRGGAVRFTRTDGRATGPLEIVDPAGRIVRRLRTGEPWDGRTTAGVPVSTGAYFVRSREDGTARVTVLR